MVEVINLQEQQEQLILVAEVVELMVVNLMDMMVVMEVLV